MPRCDPQGSRGEDVPARVSRFDPFAWVERVIPARHLHRLIRIGAVILFGTFFALRFGQYRDYLVKPLWVVETLTYGVFVFAYLVRVDPVNQAHGIREIVIPLVGGVLPFVLLTSPPASWVAARPALLYGVFWWMTAATALTVWGIWTLRHAFSITVEARRLVAHGPYRWVRHPIYLGEILTAAAVTLWRASLPNLVVLAVFILIQLFRARWEEAKLGASLPEYAAFAAHSPWL